MNFEVLTLFPDMMNAVFGESIIGRAVAAGKISVHCTDIRSYTKDKHRRVDDTPYGGGFGMVMQCQPAIDDIYVAAGQCFQSRKGKGAFGI